MKRVFLGLDLPEDVKQAVAPLCAGLPDCRWVTPDNFHITLSFLGETDEGTLEDLDRRLSDISVSPFTLSLKGCGVFETSREPKTLWLGVAGALEPLKRLQTKCLLACEAVGLRPERRKFKPHMTLARFRKAPQNRLVDFLQAHEGFESPSFEVAGFQLFQSHLSRKGADYEVLADY